MLSLRVDFLGKIQKNTLALMSLGRKTKNEGS